MEINSVLQEIINQLVWIMALILVLLTVAMLIFHALSQVSKARRERIRRGIASLLSEPAEDAVTDQPAPVRSGQKHPESGQPAPKALADFLAVPGICSRNGLQVLTKLPMSEPEIARIRMYADAEPYRTYLHRSIAEKSKDTQLLVMKLTARMRLHGFTEDVERTVLRYRTDSDAQQIGLMSLFVNGDLEAICRLFGMQDYKILLSFRQIMELFYSYGGDTAVLYQRLLHMPTDVYVKRACLQGIGSNHMTGMIGEVLPYLHSPDMNMQIDAVRTVGILQYTGAEEVLLQLAEAPEWQLRQTVADCLARLDMEKYYPVILKMLTDREWWVRFHAASALLKYEDRSRVLRDTAGLNDRFALEIISYMIEREAILEGDVS